MPIRNCLPGLMNDASLKLKILSHLRVNSRVCLLILNGLTSTAFQIEYGLDFVKMGVWLSVVVC